jgi:hypothetical protein
MTRFACPSCGMAQSAPEECTGRGTKCRGCNQPIIVPRSAPERATTPAVPPPHAIPVHPQPAPLPSLIPVAPPSLASPPSAPAATGPSAPTLRQWWGRKKWAIILGCGAVGAILLGFLVVGVKALFPSRGAVDGAPVLTQPHDRTAPLTAEEAKVRRYVLDNADDAESVEFVLWGPSASRATLKKLWEDASARYDEGIRKQGAAAKAKEDKVIADLQSKYRAATKAKAEEDKNLRVEVKEVEEENIADLPKKVDVGNRTFPPPALSPPPPPLAGLQQQAKMALDTELNMQKIREENEATARNNNPFRRALSAKVSGVVRLRYRAKNRLGAKVLVDQLFLLFEDGTIMPIENPRGDKWAESERGIDATVFAAEVKLSRQP